MANGIRNTANIFKELLITAIADAIFAWIFSYMKKLTVQTVLVLVIINLIIVIIVLILKHLKTKKQYDDMGIVNCSQTLENTELAPITCMKNIRHNLSFMGVGGEKWVKETHLMNEFKNMLRTVSSSDGRIKFLLINPSSLSYNQLYHLRNEEVPQESYAKFATLMNEFECLKVKLYDHLPSFRMQFVDDTYVAISRYYFKQELHSNAGRGLKMPHIIIEAERSIHNGTSSVHKGSLYDSFAGFFDYIWKHSSPLQDWIDNGKKFNI